MTIIEAIRERHSVRKYTDQSIKDDHKAKLQSEIDECNREGILSIQLITDEPGAFNSILARYGKFSGVKNYIALVGLKSDDLDEKVGYYGERLVLKAQQLGLNTCWVAVSFSKRKCKADIRQDEKMVCVISLGYGVNRGVPHKSKPLSELYENKGEIPDWFTTGMKAVQLAPTTVNQQKFIFSLQDNKVSVRSTGGFYSQIDIGIVKYHFEVAAGKENFSWA